MEMKGADVPEAVLPPRKKLCIAPGLRFEVGESSFAATARSTRGFRAYYSFVGTLDAEIRCDPDREVGYEITNVWVDPAKAAEEMPPTTLAELSQRVIDFVTTVRQDTDEIYVRLDDAQSDRSLMTGQLNVLRRDRRYHANTALLVEREARVAREAWAQSIDASHKARSEVMTLRTMVSALQTENGELRAADRRRQTQLLEALTQEVNKVFEWEVNILFCIRLSDDADDAYMAECPQLASDLRLTDLNHSLVVLSLPPPLPSRLLIA
ncbi:hypothetical protein Tco_1035215 [Tanacetum coccineum]